MESKRWKRETTLHDATTTTTKPQKVLEQNHSPGPHCLFQPIHVQNVSRTLEVNRQSSSQSQKHTRVPTQSIQKSNKRNKMWKICGVIVDDDRGCRGVEGTVEVRGKMCLLELPSTPYLSRSRESRSEAEHNISESNQRGTFASHIERADFRYPTRTIRL